RVFLGGLLDPLVQVAAVEDNLRRQQGAGRDRLALDLVLFVLNFRLGLSGRHSGRQGDEQDERISAHTEQPPSASRLPQGQNTTGDDGRKDAPPTVGPACRAGPV